MAIQYEDSNGTRIWVPLCSLDLLRDPKFFQDQFPEDAFFLAGHVVHNEGGRIVSTPIADTQVGGDITFVLSEKVAVNKFVLSKPDPEVVALNEFLSDEFQHQGQYPTQVDIYNQQGAGEGLHLLSGGGFPFIAQQGSNHHPKLMLIQRNGAGNEGKWTDGNGIADGIDIDRCEIMEEYTILLKEDDKPGITTAFAIQHPVDYNQTVKFKIASDDVLVRMKQKQESKILADLIRRDIKVDKLVFEGLKAEDIPPQALGLTTGRITINYGEGNHVVEGYAGIQLPQHTVFWRRFGMVRPPKGALLCTDGEGFGREIKLFEPDEVQALPAIPSTWAILKEMSDNGRWPGLRVGD